MPNRVLKESIRESESINMLSHASECTFYRLLTLADDYGLFKAKSRLVNRALFPLRDYTDDEVSGWLNEISKAGMVVFYVGEDGKPYGKIVSWEKYNTPRNSKAKFPEPTEDTKLFTDYHAFENNCMQLHADVSDCKQPRPSAGNGKQPQAGESKCPRSSSSSSNRSRDRSSKGTDVPLAGSDDPPPPPPPPVPSIPPCPQKQIVALYHEILPNHPAVSVWSEKNEGYLRARWKSNSDFRSLEWWKKSFFKRVAASDFLNARTEHEFLPDLEWLVTSSNFNKILNGRYDNRNGNGKKIKGNGKVSDITARNIKSFENWEPPEDAEEMFK